MKQPNTRRFSSPFLPGLVIGLVASLGIGVPLWLFLSERSSKESHHSFGIFPLVRTERELITLVPGHPIVPADPKAPRSTKSAPSQAVPTLAR